MQSFLSSPLRFFTDSFDSFYSLPLFIHITALHNPLNDLSCVHSGKVVTSNLPIYSHSFRGAIWVICQRHEAGGSMIDSVRNAIWDGGQVCPSWCEWGPENHRVYILWMVRGRSDWKYGELTLHCKTHSPRSYTFMIG
jgi:hypothetical protein